MDDRNFLLAGVGGQGTLLASDLLADVGLRLGYDVKKSEVHGMSQRGGAVVSHVRWGRQVASPLCEKGRVDYLIAHEMLEALRWLDYLRSGGTAVVSEQQLPPIGTVFGSDRYPPADEIVATLQTVAGRVLVVPAPEIAEALGNRRAANSVLLGVLAAEIGGMTPEPWFAAIEDKLPQRHRAVNRDAFLAGFNRATAGAAESAAVGGRG
jgi:indolepyruvate ferredoxin oxidoreductase beta subunit